MANAVRIAPSILSADLSRLGEEIRDVESCGTEWIHVDVMDGRFVPNLTMGPIVVEAARRFASGVLDVHLMMVEPERYVEAFARAGADVITVHPEASPHLQRTLAEIRRLGKRAGVALNPHTIEESIRYVLPDLDLILVMTVNPGFGGQEFIPAMLSKIARVRQMIDSSGIDIELEVDGGIGRDTAEQVTVAGARILVAGSSVFDEQDRCAAISEIHEQAVRGL